MRIIGIDPGLAGGFSVLDEAGLLLAAGNFPTNATKKNGKTPTRIDGYGLAGIIDKINPTHAFIENVSSRPRQQGQFQFGVNTGVLHGIMYAFGVEITLVPPAVWKGVYQLKRGEGEDKSQVKTRAREIASKLYPDQADFFARVKDDGVAEATLIALYGLGVVSKKGKANG